MIMCPSCQHQEIEGALFCSECGAQFRTNDLTTQAIHTNGISYEKFKNIPPQVQDLSSPSGSMGIQLLEGGQLISLAGRKEYTMGRVSDGQTIMPDIDLTPYRAYEGGVSRLHAVLKKRENEMAIMDLGSSNGTYVDGVRLKPENEHPLSHGSIISLGKLKIQFLLRTNS